MVSWGGSAAIRAIDIASATMTTNPPFPETLMALQKAKMANFYILVGAITLFKDMIALLQTHQLLWLQVGSQVLLIFFTII
jgi:hypothetical protein